MSGPRGQSRSPAVAGMFYPAQPSQCKSTAAQLLATGRAALSGRNLQTGIGAIVPHAGWMCSGAIAAEAIASLNRSQVDVVVVFGAIHTPLPVDLGILDTYSRWAVPGGESAVTSAIRDELAAQASRFAVDDRFHRQEHAVEVELPLIQAVWQTATILPIETPPNLQAVELGSRVAAAIKAAGVSAVYLASSDLTHYGPNYRFSPAGVGEAALQWALHNDERLLQLVSMMKPEQIVPEVQSHFNACGAGAIAAMLSASLESGAKTATILKHRNSFQTLAATAPQPPTNAVGYAAVWVG